MKKLDYQYALNSDCEFHLPISKKTSKSIEIDVSNLDFNLIYDDYTWMLEFKYQSKHKRRLGKISFSNSDPFLTSIANSQYFEADQQGVRYLNLTGLEFNKPLNINFSYCSIGDDFKLLGFKKPQLSDGPILIIAPHADDSELAAYGLYQDFSENVWITTINAGHNLQKLSHQYIQGLDNNISDATKRKAKIRAWNSMTTPLLAGVDFDRLSYLGYFGIAIEDIHKTADEPKLDKVVGHLPSMAYRKMNAISLPNDSLQHNTGSALVKDLVSLIEQIKPTTILVTHPEVDPHHEHVVAAHALAIAIKQASYKPERILLYVNHLRDTKHFPYGPEHARTALPPWFSDKSVFGSYSCYSHSLTMETQKNKVVALDSMHDLRSKERFEKKIKQWWSKKILKNGFNYYSNHIYFQTHIKSDELFFVVNISDFLNVIDKQNSIL